MEKKKNCLIIILVIIVLGLGCYIIYDKNVLGLKKEKSESNTTDVIEDSKIAETSNVSVKNLTKASFSVYDSNDNYSKLKKLDLEIVDGKLEAYLNYEKIEVNGIEGKVKVFLYQLMGCSSKNDMDVVVLNDKNELFVADVNHYDQDNYITFKKQSLDKEIVNITKLDFNYEFLTCGTNYIAVVTKDNKIYPYRYDHQNSKFSIYDLDVTEFKKNIMNSFILYKDNTIGIFDASGKYENKFKDKIKYNGKELIVQKYIAVNNNETQSMNEEAVSYVISDNKLYKLDIKNDMVQVLDVKVSLISEKRIIDESLNVVGEQNYYLNSIDNKVTFEDYSTYDIKNISYAINLEQEQNSK